MTRPLVSVPLILSLLVAQAGADSATSPWPHLRSTPDTPFSDTPTGLEVDGDRVYLTTRGTLAAFDVSDPTAPEFLGVSLSSGTTQRLTVSGGKAFLIGYHHGLNIHDLSDPANGLPRLGGYELTGSDSLQGVGVSGDRVFVSGYGTGLIVFDASSVTELQVEGTAEQDEGRTDYFAGNSIRIVGDKIYQAGSDDDWGALTIYQDLPGGNPVFLGDFLVINMPGVPPTGASTRVEIKGEVAYVADTGAGLIMLDVSDPTDPSQLSMPNGDTTLTNSPVEDFALSGDMIVTAELLKFSVIDVSTPTAPVLRGELDLSDLEVGYNAKVAVAGTTAYLAGQNVLAVIDFSDADNPVLIGVLEIAGRRERDIEVVGDLAYVAGNGGIGVYDISGPLPVEVGRGGRAPCQQIVVSGSRAVVRRSNSTRLEFYDLGVDGKTPQYKSTLQIGTLRHFELDGDRFYLRRPNLGFDTYNVSNLSNPRQIGHWQDPEHYVDYVRVRGNTLFAGGHSQGFGIYDLTDPNQPSLLGSLGGADMVRFIIEGSIVYGVRWTPDSNQELVVIDVSNLANPRVLASIPLKGNSNHVLDLSLGNDFLFIALRNEDTSGYVIDVSRPANPILVRDSISNANVDHLEATDSQLFLAHGFLGLQSFDISLTVPQLTFAPSSGGPTPIRLGWNAPPGLLFPIEGSRNLQDWIPMGRFTGLSLQDAVAPFLGLDPGLPAFFRATER